MAEINDYNKTISSRRLFNQTIYTPMSEALKVVAKINTELHNLL
jgi:hypothetical protein